MNGLLLDIWTTLLANGLQILGGFILAIPLYYFKIVPFHNRKPGFLKDLLIIILAAVSGTVLPLNVYGIIPLIWVALAVGLEYYLVLPLLVANLLFNMLVPSGDPGFIWRTGFPRVLLALIVAVIAGIVLKAVKANPGTLIRERWLGTSHQKSINLREFLVSGAVNVLILIGFMVIGTIANTIFQRFLWVRFMQMLYVTPQTSFIPRFFSGFNVTNPLFMLAVSIGVTLLDLTKWAALFTILKLKGAWWYFGYYLGWALILALSIFIIR